MVHEADTRDAGAARRANVLVVNDDGIAGFGEAGLGYMLSNAMRIRLGLNVHAMDTVTGRLDPANDTSSRLLWLIAPTLGFDLDF